MPIAPSLIGSGLAGWAFLSATRERQEATFAESPDIERDAAHFRKAFAEPLSLEEIMADRRVLTTALGAYGLESEIDKRAFVRRIIADGPDDRQGFARRLNNIDYIAFARRFQPGADGFITLSREDVEAVLSRARANAFEASVGEQDNDLRLALNFKDDIQAMARNSTTDDTLWFRVLGSAPLREVIQTALSLPSGFTNLGLDRQAEILSSRADRFLGGKARDALSGPDGAERMVRRFLLQRQLDDGSAALSSTALTLLSAPPTAGSAGIANLLLSNA